MNSTLTLAAEGAAPKTGGILTSHHISSVHREFCSDSMHCQTRLEQNCRQHPEACLEPAVGFWHLHISLLILNILRSISVSSFYLLDFSSVILDFDSRVFRISVSICSLETIPKGPQLCRDSSVISASCPQFESHIIASLERCQ